MQIHKFKLHIHKNGRLFGFGVSPNADWKILFVSSSILALIIGCLGAYFFIKVSKGQVIAEKKAATEDQVFDQALINRTVTYYRERQATFEKIKKGLVTPADPSL